MANFNKVILIGNLTRDPELRYTPNNVAVTKIGLAVNRRWRNQQNEQQEETTFVDCTAFARTAEVLNQYLQKGRPIFIEGRLNQRRWQDQEGNNRSKLEVVVESFQFIDGRSGGGGESPSQPTQGQASPPAADAGAGHQPVEPDDIPF